MNKLYIKVNLHTKYCDSTAFESEKKIFAPFLPLGALPLGPPGAHRLHMNNFGSLPPKDDPH